MQIVIAENGGVNQLAYLFSLAVGHVPDHSLESKGGLRRSGTPPRGAIHVKVVYTF